MSTGPSRRGLLALAGAGLVAPALAASPSPAPEVVPLWPDGPPGGPPRAGLVERAAEQGHDAAHPDRWVTGVAVPRLLVFRAPRPNGAAALLLPGGGYGFLSFDNEGLEQARWLNARGVTAFVLLYRLPGEGWRGRRDVPLQDAQRGLRLVRANAARFGVDPARLMVLGFSAGGHLAGSLATRHAEASYPPVDAADRLSARPDLAALIYPVVTLAGPATHGGSRDNLLGPHADPATRRLYSVDERLDGATPPCFLVHAGDDALVPPANSILLYTALKAADRPAELHLFAAGGHGFGTRPPASAPVSAWPRLFAAFAASRGLLPPGGG